MTVTRRVSGELLKGHLPGNPETPTPSSRGWQLRSGSNTISGNTWKYVLGSSRLRVLCRSRCRLYLENVFRAIHLFVWLSVLEDDFRLTCLRRSKLLMRLFFVEIQVPSSPLSCSLLEDRESGGYKMCIMSSRSWNVKLIDVRDILLVKTWWDIQEILRDRSYLLGPENVFPDIVWDPDRSCQPLELGVGVSGFPGGCPLELLILILIELVGPRFAGKHLVLHVMILVIWRHLFKTSIHTFSFFFFVHLYVD